MSRAANRRTVRIVSHGPSCLDGVVAAATIARFYRGHRVTPIFASNGESDRTIQALKLPAGGEDEVWVTDLSWNSTSTAERLRELAAAGSDIYWIDHHRTAVSRADAPEFKVPFRSKVLSERYSAARLTYNFIRRNAGKLGGSAAAAKALETFFPIVELADDHDRWVKRLPESGDWALAVQTLGNIEAFHEIVRLDGPKMTARLKAAADEGRQAMARSLELARSTMVEREVGNGLRIRAACTFGYTSEVAAALYEHQSRTVIALFDFKSQGVSLRRSPDCDVDLSEVARTFGGGGHAAAAGFASGELRKASAERLAAVLAEKLALSAAHV